MCIKSVLEGSLSRSPFAVKGVIIEFQTLLVMRTHYELSENH